MNCNLNIKEDGSASRLIFAKKYRMLTIYDKRGHIILKLLKGKRGRQEL